MFKLLIWLIIMMIIIFCRGIYDDANEDEFCFSLWILFLFLLEVGGCDCISLFVLSVNVSSGHFSCHIQNTSLDNFASWVLFFLIVIENMTNVLYTITTLACFFCFFFWLWWENCCTGLNHIGNNAF